MKPQFIDQKVASFREFWKRFFPESATIAQGEAHQRVNDARDGSGSINEDSQMAAHQDRVAAIYGGYEGTDWQVQTLRRLYEIMPLRMAIINGKSHLVSLGCGPGSYELWLLSQRLIGSVTLVDHSQGMIDRARAIARELGVESKMTFIVADATQCGLPNACADVVWTINSMHWSTNWRQWIQELGRVAKPGAPIFVSCTLGHPRTLIQPGELGQAVRTVCPVERGNYGMVQDVEKTVRNAPDPSALVALSFRFYTCGVKPRR